ncbi:MAG: hypothetical protein GXO81_09250 [Chlorobi bacterium]|nr:hypothetical protein [Chlorobiota bacterium]
MKKTHIILFIFIAFSLGASAQQYNQAIGIRGGYSSGFEYRVYTDDINSYKLLLSTRGRGLQLTGLKEFHQYGFFGFTEQLDFFFGLGLHAGYERWDVYHYSRDIRWREPRTALIAGLDGLCGVEYTFYEFPVSLGFEVKPFFDVWGQQAFNVRLFDFAFTLKYLF